MKFFVEIYGFLSVVLRGLILTAQTLTLGGIVFYWASWPLAAGQGGRRLLLASAAMFCVGPALAALALMAMLRGTLNLPLGEALSADAVRIDLAAAALAGFAAFALRAARGSLRLPAALVLATVAIEVGATHAASRLENVFALYVAEFVHLIGVGAWIGGIPYLLLALRKAPVEARREIVSRFSHVSMFAVALLLAGGLPMAFDYIGDWPALYGTSYGVMLAAKVALLLALLLLGGMNYLTGRRLRRDPEASVSRLRRFAEVEIGLGLTVIFCAASLTSLPPARDLPNDRATLVEIVDRVAPRLPIRLESPDHASLSTSMAAAADPQAPRAFAAGEAPPTPRNAEDIAWSEYNHHWAGVFVLIMGLLAFGERSRRLAPVARHWPLIFLVLAGFIFLRGDEEVWPLGHLGFFESLRDPEIAQHRLLMVLILVFGLFEWGVRTGRLKAGFAPYVFPLTTAAAAAFLLTHSHRLANPKEELLIEVTHMPLALVGVTAGWARWLELRLDGAPSRVASIIWPAAFAAAGLLLMFYREA